MKAKGVSLVIGADGLIGRAVADHLQLVGESVLETTRRPDTISERRLLLDLTEDVSEWHPPRQVSVAYLCAAVSSLARCRRNPAQSALVNVQNTVALAKKFVANGTFVIFLSTNLVYNGRVPFRKANEPLSPRTEYGRQKAEAERQLLALGDSISVVRLTKVIGPNMPLIKRWIQALQNNEAIHPFSDMVMAPFSLPFVVDLLYRIGTRRLPGMLQVSGERDVTYEQVARHIAERIGGNPALVQPMRSEEAGLQLEAVPRYTTLETARLRTEFGIEPPDVWSAIDSVFDL